MQGYCVKCRAKKEMKNCQGDHYEERETGDSGCLPYLRHQDVPNRKGITIAPGVVDD